MKMIFTPHSRKKSIQKLIVLMLLMVTGIVTASAQASSPVAAAPSYLSNPVFIGLLSVIVVLLIVIIILGEVVKAAAAYRKDLMNGANKSSFYTIVLLMIGGSLIPDHSFAQASTTVVTAQLPSGLDDFTFYLMLSIIMLEVLIAGFLYRTAMELLRTKITNESEEKANVPLMESAIMDKWNASVAIEKEEEIMFDHEYDGIRELDNNLPPWWKYGFYITVIFSVIYLIHYHVTFTGKSQLQEYQEQLDVAKAELDEYKKKTADLVDETNVTLLTDNVSLAEGKTVYTDNCVACHGKLGEGTVGPNLTDNYWLHGGGVKEIFKSVKFGWPEKGMKSWQQDLSAKQIHQVSSYIKSLAGTNPPNAKEHQGELYTETVTTGADTSAKIPADSLALAPVTK